MGMAEVLFYIMMFIFIYYLVLTIGYTLLLFASFPDTYKNFKLGKYTNLDKLINQKGLVPVTVITPFYNDKDNLLNSVQSALNSNYTNIEIILVNDGSTDDSLSMLKDYFKLYEVPPVIKQTFETAPILARYQSRNYPNVTVLDKEHAGSADAVNAGLNACDTPLYITLDSDTVIEPDSISHAMFAMLSEKHCIAVGGSVYVQNACRIEQGKIIEKRLPYDFVSAHQTSEYLRAFLYGRAGWNKLGGTLCYSGAFTMYETQAVRDAVGYEKDNFSYDVEIIMKLHHYMSKHKFPYKIYYTVNALAWTLVPSTLKRYWIQRNHWQRGMLGSTFKYIGMFFNPTFKSFGFINYPYYVIYEVFGSIVEFISYVSVFVLWYFGWLNNYALFLFFVLAWGYSAYLTMACILLNTITFNTYSRFIDTLNMLSLSVVEMIGFRQYRAACCFTAYVQYLFNRLMGKKQ